MKTRILIMASVIGLLATTFGFAQSDQIIHVKIPFSFMVGEKLLPAGEYDFGPNALNDAIKVTSAEKGEGGDAIVLTQLSDEFHNTGRGHVVFDKVGNTHFLSEIWIPDTVGFLVYAPSEKHTHVVVKASE